MELLFTETDLYTKLLITFRLMGLIAYVLIWGYLITSAFLPQLQDKFGEKATHFNKFLGVLGLVFATLHPMFFYFAHFLIKQSISPLTFLGGIPEYFGKTPYQYFAYLGVVAWHILSITVPAVVLTRSKLHKKYYHLVYPLNCLLFVLVWVHVLMIGTELALTPYKIIHYFLGITFLVSIIFKIKTSSLVPR